ncbi:helix-turn-helix domain-containing protein [Tsukamurella pseudospumae]|uniref:Helix-turn-helix domain-containing protein n=1 Tax=Tsukamurella pseudospumae TaxID=239498 RepID=A0A138AWH6_9ACTN|nr:helix-turn-helix domain-containing protein [Tsukamurella pseudospumae]KXP14801.1 hypothetical protein AXK60_02670 [Tsukamurella pseudospumae]
MTATLHTSPDPEQPISLDHQPAWAHPVIEFLRDAAEHGYSVQLTAKLDTMTPAQMADRLGVSRATISRRIASGDIRALKVGNRHRITTQEFARYREEMMISIAEQSQDDFEVDLRRG